MALTLCNPRSAQSVFGAIRRGQKRGAATKVLATLTVLTVGFSGVAAGEEPLRHGTLEHGQQWGSNLHAGDARRRTR